MRQIHKRRGKCNERGDFEDERKVGGQRNGQLDSWTLEIWNIGTLEQENRDNLISLMPIDLQMNKLRFNIKNALLYYKFWNGYKSNKIDYPEILDYLDKTYGTPVFTNHFQNLDHWKIKDRFEWGSAPPGNLCAFVKGNVKTGMNHGNQTLVINTTPELVTGKGWDGKDVTKPISSGLVSSNFLVRPGQVVSATVNTSKSYPGSWFAFWLMKKK